ncbi:hypothetical protein JCM31826_06970 [Thermaurantimonas aggregans]|uniref:Secretion system C-terminal sorting domain-containing protein n=1 Tax=Thermaurantimonas aggregans TaxID=2173829 RepID=A0A401XJK6_9FLAO|nr:hypothetical protein [Thermaurantimonas aggregans]MCX8149233.1 hypothetical protein [Thermaurantimonas aggregans]GCD77215.1 hypothetical protein JCM31826_06970 [Thermaurantimonas aggregans]
MFNKFLYSLLIAISVIPGVKGQSDFPYELSLKPLVIQNLPGLHSYSYGQHQGTWLIIGGRKDGLHARQPFNAFPASMNNTDIYVIDPVAKQFWTASVNSLPTGIREQFQSTNMNFHQEGDTLYIIGGYAFSASANGHITFPYLSTVRVSEVINAIKNNQSIGSFIKQIQDTLFAVTGGHLKMIDNVFYLVGGHRFDGRYNPMNNPTFTQRYTNQIRKFTVNNSGSQLSFGNVTAITDPIHLHRRDYNLVPQIYPNGKQGLMISSGVFQVNADLPYLYPVDIFDSGYFPQPNFNQYLSNYHSAVLPLYDSVNNRMHTIFFGGMSQYYYQNGQLIQDNQVPFVRTISRVTRDANGQLTEYKLPVEMPSLKGSSAEFILNHAVPHYTNEVVKLHQITQDSVLVGYIYGGIQSTALNPFSNNQTNLTSADPGIYEVWLKKTQTIGQREEKLSGENPYQIEVYPNPFKKDFTFTFKAERPVDFRYYITNSKGQILLSSDKLHSYEGKNDIEVKGLSTTSKEELLLTVVFENRYYVVRKLLKK